MSTSSHSAQRLFRIGLLTLRLRRHHSCRRLEGPGRTLVHALPHLHRARQHQRIQLPARQELSDAPLVYTRLIELQFRADWSDDAAREQLLVSSRNGIELLFDVRNSQTVAVEIEALGAPLEFNNIFTGRTAAQTNKLCSLFDPYIGRDTGYVQVVPLLGTLPPLLGVPAASSPLEGWHFLPEDGSNPPYYQSQKFEGLHEWQFHMLPTHRTSGRASSLWNVPTLAVLQPIDVRAQRSALRFHMAPSVRAIDTTLQANARPVAMGILGYVLRTGS
ncbi:unnamed protein product [Mycena citricolor]|uniref:Uncharacterized protein n=1 Tax=Mycena citricolor TaxID=2018698 RepID=A0AAD2K7A3_9AGAR|nr:unnamed protein product [Mycena citricolor]